jgi:hypothetical protein
MKIPESFKQLWKICEADQVVLLQGIGDILKDDLKHLHQGSKKITDQTSTIKNITQQPLS